VFIIIFVRRLFHLTNIDWSGSWNKSKRLGGGLLIVNFILDVILHLDIILGEIKTLEGERGELGGLLKESLLKADSHTELVIDEPDLVEIDDGHALLPLLDRVERDRLLLHRVRLGDEGAVGLSENLELDSGWVLLLTRANHGLVERLLEDCDVELLAEPLLGIGSDRVHDDIIELLELVVELHRLDIVGVEGQIERVGGASSTLISEGTQTVRGSHEGELDVELLVVASVEVDGLTAILVLTKFRKLHSGRREIGGALDSERHCWLVISILGG
jgi:hypothetical protein